MQQNSNEEQNLMENPLSNWSLHTVDPTAEFRCGQEEKEEDKHVPEDWRDVSLHPSYATVKAPLHTDFQRRVREKEKKLEEQLQYEIHQLIAYQSTAFDAACMERHMCITTLWPPLHSLKEIENTQKYFFHNVSKKERKRIDFLLNNNIY